jgi:hypothetical protein
MEERSIITFGYGSQYDTDSLNLTLEEAKIFLKYDYPIEQSHPIEHHDYPYIKIDEHGYAINYHNLSIEDQYKLSYIRIDNKNYLDWFSTLKLCSGVVYKKYNKIVCIEDIKYLHIKDYNMITNCYKQFQHNFLMSE